MKLPQQTVVIKKKENVNVLWWRIHWDKHMAGEKITEPTPFWYDWTEAGKIVDFTSLSKGLSRGKVWWEFRLHQTYHSMLRGDTLICSGRLCLD